MSQANTEARHHQAQGLDQLEDADILKILHAGQLAAADVVRQASDALIIGARAMTKTVRDGHALVYAAAGSSGLQAMADGLEITPTFGVPINQIRILRAGGLDDMSVPKGDAEDDAESARRDAAVIEDGDCVICLAASGRTTYPVIIMEEARRRGGVTIGMSNNPGTPLLEQADIPVLLPTPPEVIAGSTRLGAGTAQKIALNMMSSLMGVLLGHVMDGMMVNVIANNRKLFDRAEGIVMHIAKCERSVAADALTRTGGAVKEAILLVNGVASLREARIDLDRTGGHLRDALKLRSAG